MWTGCSKSVTTPTPVTGQLTRFSVIGNASLTAIGETSQLTATAIFSDGALEDLRQWVERNNSTPAEIDAEVERRRQ
jgi:hypothetical protein